MTHWSQNNWTKTKILIIQLCVCAYFIQCCVVHVVVKYHFFVRMLEKDEERCLKGIIKFWKRPSINRV